MVLGVNCNSDAILNHKNPIVFIFKESSMARRNDGKETWSRLLQWDSGHASAERLAAIILHNEGIQNIDPLHLLGGRDDLKDMVISSKGVI